MKRLYIEYYLMVIGLVIGFTWFVFPQLPQVMVTHWGFWGQPNGWMNRSFGAWLLPMIISLLWLMWEVTPLIEHSEADRKLFYPPFRLLGLFIFLFLGALQVVVLGINLGWQIDMLRVVSWQFVIFTAVLGQLLPVIPRNSIVGVRTSWSMKSADTWRKTHQETGRWCRAASLIDIVILILLPLPWGFLAVMSGFVGCLLWGVVLSYIYRRC